MGLSESERRRVVQDIFGVNGVITVTDEHLFDARLNDITARVNTASGNTKFSKYFDSTLRDSVRNGLVVPALKACINPNWTNNQCESANHKLKSEMEWKKLKLPVLVRKLRKISHSQQQDLIRAMSGAGNWYLPRKNAHYFTDSYVWESLPSPQKRKRVEDFIKNKRRLKTMVWSSDENVAVNCSPRAGRKPGERKGKHFPKTITFSQ